MQPDIAHNATVSTAAPTTGPSSSLCNGLEIAASPGHAWDIRHRINANIIFRATGAVENLIGEAELTFLVTVASGLPYTSNTRDVFPLFTPRNDARLPCTKMVDMRFRKTFSFAGTRLSLLAEVLNLFDWRNVTYIEGDPEGIAMYEATGDPSGPYGDPQTYSRPRVYRLGFELQF